MGSKALLLAMLIAAALAFQTAGQAPAATGVHPYPLWPSEPVPGWPGVGLSDRFTRYGQPEFLAYPGAVHHVRNELQRYVPPYPILNHVTLVKNFILHEMADYKDRCIEWAEPVYYNPMYEPRVPTAQTRPPVKVLVWEPGGAPIRLQIGRLSPSLYALRPICAAPAVRTVQPKKYVFLKLRINDEPGDPAQMNAYVLRAMALDNFYAIQEFHFHAEDDRAFQAEISLLPQSDVPLHVYNVDLHDRLKQLARRRGKRQSTLSEDAELAARWQRIKADPAYASTVLRPADEQRRNDDQVWRQMLPPLNCHTISGTSMNRYDGNPATDRICLAPEEWEGLYPWLRREGERLVYDAGTIENMYENWSLGQAGRIRTGDARTERDMAIRLIRLAYNWPAWRPGLMVNYFMSSTGLDRPLIRRYQWFPEHRALVENYDRLFPVIDGNRELADAVGRYLPWVKTPDDVVALLDTYLVQDMANDIMHYRYFYDHGQAGLMVTAALVQDDVAISRPWMEFLWTRGWEYPQALGGCADNVVTSLTRDGGTNIGSFYYGEGGHKAMVDLLSKYIARGGDKKYDLSDPDRYPQISASRTFVLEAAAAGRNNPQIGDVGSPARPYNQDVGGWGNERPDPFLLNRSRILSDWNGYLEAGQGDPDFRFHSAVAVRVGVGQGHDHRDTLDLRLWSHGITMAGDAGQRPAYGDPKHQRSITHNVMNVDGRDWASHAWVGCLFDAPGSPYLRADSVAPYGMEYVKLFRRQVSLVDADAGRPSAQAPPERDPEVVTPSRYVFDVFRGSGGRSYTYCFHGIVDDGLEVNVKNRKFIAARAGGPDEEFMKEFMWRDIDKNVPDNLEWAADCDGDVLQATWRGVRGAEQQMYAGLGGFGGAMTPPRKYTRLHLLDQAGSRILHGIVRDDTVWQQHKPQWPQYCIRCIYAQRRSETPADTVFVALIEPYAGEPFITERRLLAVEGDEADALRAVAAEVKTANGHTDLLFADGRPERIRRVGGVEIAGEYACLSRDAQGLRQATLVAGKLLRAPDVAIEVAEASYGGKIRELDYLKRRITVAGRIPARLSGHFFEAGGDEHKTSYEVSGVETGGASVLTLRKGLEIMRTRITSADPEKHTVTGAIAMIRARGRDRGLVASNDEMTKFWRVAYVSGDRHTGHVFELSPMDGPAQGRPFTAQDFPPGSGLSVWELGVGDEMRIRTGVSLRRLEDPSQFEVYATSPFRLSLAGRSLEVSADGGPWARLAPAKGGDGVEIGEAWLGKELRLRAAAPAK